MDNLEGLGFGDEAEPDGCGVEVRAVGGGPEVMGLRGGLERIDEFGDGGKLDIHRLASIRGLFHYILLVRRS